ncbi:MAG TPA: hypothetical protein VHW96_20180 [Solirubrobacteraceae bacterium]|jgi:hypothetical protein|nr:hypothetical protein [Solirubrobacteraceae bacterium]
MPDNAAGLVYGTILVATLLSAESALKETYAKTILGVLVALATYWLALTYARFTGERLEEGSKATVGGLVNAAVHELTVLYGAAVPFVALLAFWAGGASLNTAVIGAVYFADAAIIGAEIVIGVRAGLRGKALIGQAAIGAILGVLVLALRLVLH